MTWGLVLDPISLVLVDCEAGSVLSDVSGWRECCGMTLISVNSTVVSAHGQMGQLMQGNTLRLRLGPRVTLRLVTLYRPAESDPWGLTA